MRASIVALAVTAALMASAAAETRDQPLPAGDPPLAATPFDSAKAASDALGTEEIAAIQRALIWTGDLNTMASGEFGKRTFEAVRAFQRRLKSRDTGVLLPKERAALDERARRAVAAYGFKTISEGGVTLGYPAKLALKRTAVRNGSRYASLNENVTVDILRIQADGEPFEALFERLRAERPGRTIAYSLVRPDFFVVSGSVDGKSFYMRFLKTSTDSRGFIVGWAPALSPDFDRVPIAMAVSLAVDAGQAVEAAVPAVPQGPPVPLPAGAAKAARSGPGFAVSQGGEVLTSATLVAGCSRVTLADGSEGRVIAGDLVNDIALVRVPNPPSGAVTWRAAPLRAGEAVTVLASAGGRVTRTAAGVTGLSGPAQDMRRFTMAAGSPGGGVFDSDGALAGLLAGSGRPDAVKGMFLAAFLRSQRVAMPSKGHPDPAVASVLLTCDPASPQ